MAEPVRKHEPEPEPAREPNLIGKPFRRVDGRAKVTGATKFADDLTFPRLCHVKLVRSRVPHAIIVSIDVSEAEKVPGFLGYLTGKEMPITFGIPPVAEGEPALCPDRVRFGGDPVVAVAAVTEDAAYEAALRVKVEYEPLPTISSIEEALATPEPRIHQYGDHGNVHKLVPLKSAASEGGLAEAAVVPEDTFSTKGTTNLPMNSTPPAPCPRAPTGPNGPAPATSSTRP